MIPSITPSTNLVNPHPQIIHLQLDIPDPFHLLFRYLSQLKIAMEARPQPTSAPSLNPPSVEIAYKRKCIALKKRLAEVEAENELMRTRNRRGWQYIQKMRLESCMLLERLAKVTGMTEEAQAGAADPELRARAVAMMSSVASMNGLGGGASGHNGPSLEDETEGSSDEQPPTVSSKSFPFALHSRSVYLARISSPALFQLFMPWHLSRPF